MAYITPFNPLRIHILAALHTANSARRRAASSNAKSQRTLWETLEPRVLLTATPMEDRGWISVIVDNTRVAGISSNLTQFAQDQLGEGWTHVSVHTDAPRMEDQLYIWNNSTHQAVSFANGNLTTNIVNQYKSDLAAVKAMIAADAAAAIAAGSQLNAVVIIGHVTVPYSGYTTPYDAIHGARAFPTDRYYSDLDASPETWGITTRLAPAPATLSMS